MKWEGSMENPNQELLLRDTQILSRASYSDDPNNDKYYGPLLREIGFEAVAQRKVNGAVGYLFVNTQRKIKFDSIRGTDKIINSIKPVESDGINWGTLGDYHHFLLYRTGLGTVKDHTNPNNIGYIALGLYDLKVAEKNELVMAGKHYDDLGYKSYIGGHSGGGLAAQQEPFYSNKKLGITDTFRVTILPREGTFIGMKGEILSYLLPLPNVKNIILVDNAHYKKMKKMSSDAKKWDDNKLLDPKSKAMLRGTNILKIPIAVDAHTDHVGAIENTKNSSNIFKVEDGFWTKHVQPLGDKISLEVDNKWLATEPFRMGFSQGVGQTYSSIGNTVTGVGKGVYNFISNSDRGWTDEQVNEYFRGIGILGDESPEDESGQGAVVENNGEKVSFKGAGQGWGEREIWVEDRTIVDESRNRVKIFKSSVTGEERKENAPEIQLAKENGNITLKPVINVEYTGGQSVRVNGVDYSDDNLHNASYVEDTSPTLKTGDLEIKLGPGWAVVNGKYFNDEDNLIPKVDETQQTIPSITIPDY